MAVYLALTDRVTGECFAGGGLIQVDERMARAFGSEPDPVEWYFNWMDTIGFCLAAREGETGFDNAHKYYGKGRAKLIDWLQATYKNSSY